MADLSFSERLLNKNTIQDEPKTTVSFSDRLLNKGTIPDQKDDLKGLQPPVAGLSKKDQAEVDAQEKLDFAEAETRRKSLGLSEDDFRELTLQEQEERKPSFLERVGESITGSERETEETEGLPEIGQVDTGLGAGASLKVAAGLLVTNDEEAEMSILRTQIPDIKFRRDKKRNIIITLPNGEEAVLNQPGISFQDVIGFVGDIASFTPAGRVSKAVAGTTAKVALGGTAAGATDLALQKASQELGSGQDIDLTRAGLAAGLGGVAETVAPIISRAVNKSRAKRFDLDKAELDEALPVVKESQEAVEEIAKLSPTGEQVPLTKAQQTQVPSQLVQQRAIGEIPAGARIAKEALEKQNKAASNAVDDVLNTISDPLAIERGAKNFKEASKKAIEAAKTVREEASSDIYNAAFTDAVKLKIPLDGVKSTILAIRKTGAEGGLLKKAMDRSLKLISGKNPKLENLHNAKLEIDAMITDNAAKGLDNVVNRKLVEVKNQLVETLKEASPLYKEASEKFAELSPAVEDLGNSIIGQASRISDVQLKNLSKKIFDATEANPDVLRNAKKVINEVDPNAWDDLLRTEFERRLGSIRSSKQGLPNTPADLERAIFGTNDAQTRAIMEAASPTLRKNLRHLRIILKRAKEGRGGGSDTAAKLQAKEEREVVRIMGLFKPVEALAGAGRKAAQFKKDKAIARSMFDTKFITKLNKLKKFDIDTPAYAKALAQLLKEEDNDK